MEDRPRVSPYQCLQCGAAGELSLTAGDASCPHCGKHLWTVRSEPQPPARTSLGPDYRLPLLPGRPPLSRKGLWRVRLCVVLFRPIIMFWLLLRQRIMETRVNSKLEEVSNCRKRGQLLQLLGNPLYAVNGEACHAPNHPDLIECYESEGCCIDLWFKNDRLIDVSGFVKPTKWDIGMTRNLGYDAETPEGTSWKSD